MDSPTQTRPSAMPLEQAVEVLLKDLPAPVRAFVMGPNRGRVALELSQKYRLHADQAGEFERAYVLMLLGAFTPEEFVAALRGAGIPETSVTALAADVNREVFIPLRDEERRQPSAPPAEPAPTVQASPTPAESLLPAPPPQPPALPEHDSVPSDFPVATQPSAPSAIPPSARPAMPEPPKPPVLPPPSLVPPPAPPAQIFAERRVAPLPPPNLPGQEPINRLSAPVAPPDHPGYITRTMSRDMMALKQGKDPFEIAHPDIQPAAPHAPPAPSAPVRSAATAAQAPRPLQPSVSAPTQPPAARAAAKYPSDPYREPIG